jgi:hypothetical protein
MEDLDFGELRPALTTHAYAGRRPVAAIEIAAATAGCEER